jgi:tetratricopeptide (TPR) repeat protein
MSDSPDIDMRKSLLVQIYLNMAAAYIQTHHYYLAEKLCDEALELTDQVSQLYFRKAQAIALRKDATIEDVTQAQQLINKALQMRPN